MLGIRLLYYICGNITNKNKHNMKNTILTLAFFLVASTQVVGQVSEVPVVEYTTIGKVGSIYKSVMLTDLSGGHYSIAYKNLEYPELFEYSSIVFAATQEELDLLYNTLLEMCNSTIGTRKTLTLGSATLYLRTQGLKQVKISVSQKWEIDSWTWLSRKQLSKLFGK